MKPTNLGSHSIGSTGRCFIIAEAGVNHNGDLKLALELVRQAKRCGADCVKFQTFKADQVVTRTAPKAAYQLKVTDVAESQYDMLKRLELSDADLRTVMEACKSEGILFLSTPYDIEDARLLHELGVTAFKLASIHLVETPFLRRLAQFKKPLIVSTGMATLAEIDEALRAIRENGNPDVYLLQCTTNYPSDLADTNLRAMGAMQTSFQVTVGYSDHTEGISACLAAVALGAAVIEKHFTLDRALPGPDHRCSSDPAEFTSLVRGIREVELALGSSVKRPSERERINALNMRRSIVTRLPIAKGTRLTEDLLTFKRPAAGLQPARLGEVLGRTTRDNLPADKLLQLTDLE